MAEIKEQELWKPVTAEGFEDLYDVSNMGNIRNKKTKNIVKPYKAGKYLMNSLSKKGKLDRFLVHRLVACAFVEDPEDDDKNNIVNHLDGNKFNNKASNLEWTSLSGNAKHSREILGQKKTNKAIVAIDDDENETQYESITKAMAELNLAKGSITSCLRGRQEESCGYRFRYVDPKYNVQIVDLTTMRKLSNNIEFENFPNYYINENGQIYGTNKRQFLTHNLQDGYPKVMLYHLSKPYCYYVHVLVAKIFIPNPDGKKVVNHKDHNKVNCHISNLEWVTHSENANKYFEHKKTLKASSVLNQESKELDGSRENPEVEVESDEE